jgi:Fe-S cluster assembly iron-binding protein IscA
MLRVTDKAVALLKAVKRAEGATSGAGIRILHDTASGSKDHGAITIGVAISEDPVPNDGSFEQDGLRIFVEDKLIEPLDGRTLDVREASEGMELIFR